MASIVFGRKTLKLISSLIHHRVTNPSRRYTTLPITSSPWLRLPDDVAAPNGDHYDNFLNIVDKRVVKLEMFNSYCTETNMVCIGSSRGTLAYFSESGRIYTVYPYTGGGCKHGVADYNTSFRYFTRIDNMLTFLCDTEHGNDSPHTDSYQVFIADRSGYRGPWEEYHHLFRKEDPPFAYCAKNRTAYKVSTDSNHHLCIQLIDLFGEHLMMKSQFTVVPAFNGVLPSNMEKGELDLRMQCNQDRYLVLTGESGEAEPVPYLVIRYHNRERGAAETRAVDVFKFDLLEKRVTYTTKLDGHAFFVGLGSDPFAISVQDCPELKSDSIYISDDLRVFDLKERCSTPLLDIGDLSMTRPQTFWMALPTLEEREIAEVARFLSNFHAFVSHPNPQHHP